MGLAFRVRDAISARFGVARIKGFSHKPSAPPAIDNRLDFFLAERADPQHPMPTARDRHLDVMISVLARPNLSIAASVVTHNRFGRAYLSPVRPAHRLLVWLIPRRMRRDLAQVA